MRRELTTLIEGYPVELPKIEKELTAFWQGTAGEELGDAVLRATTLNLILVCMDAKKYRAAVEFVPEITEHHPGRIILAYVDPESDADTISAYISAYCQPPRDGGKQICCEQITLATGPRGVEHLPGAFLPLLLPDLPVFLCCQSVDLLKVHPFRDFYHMIDRLILEIPVHWPDAGGLKRMIDDVLPLRDRTRLSDLTWAGLTDWREAVAQFFDGPEMLPHLERIEHVRIAHSGPGISAAAFLIGAWLASRLGWKWKLGGREPRRFLFTRSDGESAEMEIVSDSASESPGGLLAVELVSDHPSEPLTLRCERDGRKITQQKIRDGATLESNDFAVLERTPEQLLCDELDFIEEDRIFVQALHVIREMLSPVELAHEG